MVTADAVRAFLPRGPDVPAIGIAGWEVHTETRGNRLYCTASLTDFTVEELVVVQVHVGVY